MVEQTTRNESSVEANIEDKVLNTIRGGNNPLVWANRIFNGIDSLSLDDGGLKSGLRNRFKHIFWGCMETVIRQRIEENADLSYHWAEQILEPQQYSQQYQVIPQPLKGLREQFETLFLECLENPHEQVDNQPDTTVTLAETPTRDNGNKSRHQQNLAHLSPLDRKRYRSQREEKRFSRGTTVIGRKRKKVIFQRT